MGCVSVGEAVAAEVADAILIRSISTKRHKLRFNPVLTQN